MAALDEAGATEVRGVAAASGEISTGTRILGFLMTEHGLKCTNGSEDPTEREIRKWLTSKASSAESGATDGERTILRHLADGLSITRMLKNGGVNDELARQTVRKLRKLIHLVAQWRDREPLFNSVDELARISGLSLDQLSKKPKWPTSAVEDDPRVGIRWFSEFLEKKCEHLCCYVASISTARWREWEATAKRSGADPQTQIKVAETWAQEISVLTLSESMRKYHRIVNRDEACKQKMHAYLERRIGWTRDVNKYGSALAAQLREETYGGIFQLAANGQSPSFNRYPAMQPQDDKSDPQLYQLTVGADQLPSPAAEIYWLIYYEWRRMADAELKVQATKILGEAIVNGIDGDTLQGGIVRARSQ